MVVQEKKRESKTELAKKLGEEGRQRIITEGLVWESVAERVKSILASEI